ncbi:MAG: diguanylate cyclase [Bacillota bacterium]|nr:diguanylate cyclase [Bacillota bacterium]
MRLDFTLAAIIIASAMLLIICAAYIFTRKERLLGLKLLGFYAISNAVYSAAYAGYLLSDSESVMIGYMSVGYFAASFMMPLWYLISMQQFHGTRLARMKMGIVIGAVPALAMIALILYPWNVAADLPWWRTLFFRGHEVSTYLGASFSGFVGIHFEKGIFFYVLMGYSLFLAILAAIRFGKLTARKEGVAKGRARLLFIDSLVAVVVLSITFVGRATPLISPGSLAVNLVPLLAFLALFRYEMFDLIPTAYSELFRKSESPTVILDDGRNVVMLNPAADRLFGKLPRGPEDHYNLDFLHKDGGAATRELFAGHDSETELAIDGKTHHYRITLTNLGKSKKKPTGYFAVYQDITTHKDEMRRMEQMAAYDELTKIYNRRYFFRKATEAFDEAVANRENVRVLMFDLDDFKGVNDIYGHQAGDSILAQMAKLVAGALGPEDIFARYGGEEFVIFRKNVIEAEARILDEKVCEAIANHAFLYQRRNIKITGSFGVAGSKGPVNKPLERYIKEADDAMYLSKTAGKNAVSYSPDLK